MSICFILMALLSLIISLILMLTYWRGSTAYPDHIDLDAYREPILRYLAGGIERWRPADKPLVHMDDLAD